MYYQSGVSLLGLLDFKELTHAVFGAKALKMGITFALLNSPVGRHHLLVN